MLTPIFQSTFMSLEISYAKAKKVELNMVNISEKIIPRLLRADADIRQGLLV